MSPSKTYIRTKDGRLNLSPYSKNSSNPSYKYLIKFDPFILSNTPSANKLLIKNLANASPVSKGPFILNSDISGYIHTKNMLNNLSDPSTLGRTFNPKFTIINQITLGASVIATPAATNYVATNYSGTTSTVYSYDGAHPGSIGYLTLLFAANLPAIDFTKEVYTIVLVVDYSSTTTAAGTTPSTEYGKPLMVLHQLHRPIQGPPYTSNITLAPNTVISPTNDTTLPGSVFIDRNVGYTFTGNLTQIYSGGQFSIVFSPNSAQWFNVKIQACFIYKRGNPPTVVRPTPIANGLPPQGFTNLSLYKAAYADGSFNGSYISLNTGDSCQNRQLTTRQSVTFDLSSTSPSVSISNINLIPGLKYTLFISVKASTPCGIYLEYSPSMYYTATNEINIVGGDITLRPIITTFTTIMWTFIAVSPNPVFRINNPSGSPLTIEFNTLTIRGGMNGPTLPLGCTNGVTTDGTLNICK